MALELAAQLLLISQFDHEDPSDKEDTPQTNGQPSENEVKTEPSEETAVEPMDVEASFIVYVIEREIISRNAMSFSDEGQ
jgi:hypothetical protein